ncbi:hypothetical protein GE09DRAFT_1117986 [Coniochaeta sp. 2T2.1]|nr:hypothetical protein GE09DRAFT_1117986 [Coniochaeta sp. 2T2.1]
MKLPLVSLALLVVGIDGAQTVHRRALTCAPRPTKRALLRNSRRAGDCAPDACLDALGASAQRGCTRMADLDCASYLMTTVTPDVSTVYVTTSLYTTLIGTESVLTSKVVNETVTETEEHTITTTLPTTSTSQVGEYTVTQILTRTTVTLEITATATQGQACSPPCLDFLVRQKRV